jgi:hypothetical protein
MGHFFMIFCAFVFVLGTLVSNIFGGTWYDNTDLTNMQNLTTFNTQTTAGIGGSSIQTMATNFFTTGLPTMIVWGYPYLDNTIGGIFKLIFLWPISIGMIWAVAQLFLPALWGIFGQIRGALGF